MRGSCLSHSDTLEALRGFIVTSWSGNTDMRNPAGMPEAVARVHATAAGSVVKGNIKCFILTPDGEVEAVFNAFPNNDVSSFGFDSDEAGRFFARSVRHFSSGLKIPEREKEEAALSLPKTLPDGTPADARMLLHISPRSQPMQYRASVAVPLKLGDTLRAALRGSDQSRELQAGALSSVLEHFYPPAIMQRSGAISAVAGTLTLSPLGASGQGRWAALTGTATLTLDDGEDTRFEVEVDALVQTDPASGELRGVRGILHGVCPKISPGGRGRTHHLEMTATFASFNAAD